MIDENAFSPGGIFTTDRLLNVLDMNLAMDKVPVQ